MGLKKFILSLAFICYNSKGKWEKIKGMEEIL
jgi:hypothetical protein